MSKKLEELIPRFKEIGFEVKDDLLTYDKVSYSTMIVNGQHYRQEHHNILSLLYIGDGCELGESDCELEGTEFCEFDVLDEGGHGITTICISDINDLDFLLNSR